MRARHLLFDVVFDADPGVKHGRLSRGFHSSPSRTATNLSPRQEYTNLVRGLLDAAGHQRVAADRAAASSFRAGAVCEGRLRLQRRRVSSVIRRSVPQTGLRNGTRSAWPSLRDSMSVGSARSCSRRLYSIPGAISIPTRDGRVGFARGKSGIGPTRAAMRGRRRRGAGAQPSSCLGRARGRRRRRCRAVRPRVCATADPGLMTTTSPGCTVPRYRTRSILLK